MKHLQQTNQAIALRKELETRKKVLTEIGAYSENEEERTIVKAQLEPQIIHYDFSNPAHKKIIIAEFVEWGVMIGIKDTITPEENIINAKFIITNYPHITITEIRQAINWSVVGKLDVDATPYGKLSPMYMAKIINAYLDKRDMTNKQLKMRLTSDKARKEMEAKYNKPYDQEVKAHRQFLIDKLPTYIQSDKVDVALNLLAWRFMKRAKKVDESMFDINCQEYATEMINQYKMTQAYKNEIQTLSDINAKTKIDAAYKRYMEHYTIKKALQRIDKLTEWINSLPPETIIPNNK